MSLHFYPLDIVCLLDIGTILQFLEARNHGF
jgi:hypothetical protein